MKSLYTLFHPAHSVFLSIALVAAVYLGTLAAVGTSGFWITDNANKFLQAESIADSGYTDYSLHRPGKRIDPDFRYNPVPSPFSVVENGNLYSVFSPVFAVVSSAPYRLLGHGGLYLIPLISSLLMLFGLANVSRLLGLGSIAVHAVVIIGGLCTPVWFYSVVFWEHTAAVCLCIWAVYWFLRFHRSGVLGHLIAGSILAALGIWFRDELYLFCIVLVGVTLHYKRDRRISTLLTAATAMIAVSVPLWLFQWKTIGHPFGFHLGTHILSADDIFDHVFSRFQVFYNLAVMGSPSVFLSLLTASPFITAAVWRPRFSGSAFKIAMPSFALAAIVSALITLGGFAFADSPIARLLQSNGLFAAAPFLVLAFIQPRTADETDSASPAEWLLTAALAYAAVYILAAPVMGSTGIHWGNRFLLTLYPMLAALAVSNIVRWAGMMKSYVTPHTIALAAVILVSFAAQVYSIDLLKTKKDFSRRLNAEIARQPEEIVITNLWWAPQAMYTAFRTKAMFYVASEREYERLVRLLGENGYNTHLFASQRPIDRATPEVARLDDSGLNFFSLSFYLVDEAESTIE